MNSNLSESLSPYNSSLEGFCRFLEVYGQQAENPQRIAELWESQAEALRIGSEDASVEAIDMLLHTMLSTLHSLAEAQERKRWPNRMKALVRVQADLAPSGRPRNASGA